MSKWQEARVTAWKKRRTDDFPRVNQAKKWTNAKIKQTCDKIENLKAFFGKVNHFFFFVKIKG